MKEKRQKVNLEESGQCMCIRRGSEGHFYEEFANQISILEWNVGEDQ